MRWREEIDELHEFFEAYFLGAETSLKRAETVLAAAFTMVSPDGRESDRGAIIRMLSGAHAHTAKLTITTSDHRLVHQAESTIVASYVEHQELVDGANQRLSTVVFVADAAAPNGLLWLHVHETWINPSGA